MDTDSASDTNDVSVHPPWNPGPVKSGQFTYDAGGIQYDGIHRADSRRLGRVKNATKPWNMAQLTLYGIPFVKSHSAAKIRDLLHDLHKRKKLKNPTPEFQAFEASLAETYNRQQRNHEQAVKDWILKQFLALSSPREELNFNMDMFFAKYFVTNGQPDRTKQKDALILGGILHFDDKRLSPVIESIPGLATYITKYVTVIGWEESLPGAMDAAFAKLVPLDNAWGFSLPTEEASFDFDRFMNKYFLRDGIQKNKEPIKIICRPEFEARLLDAVRTVPGLYFGVASPWGNEKCMFIGWDGLEVNKKVRACKEEREKEDAEKEAEKQREAEEENAIFFEPHYEFLRTWKPSSGELTLADLQGSFIARCPEVHGYMGDEGELQIHIQPLSSPHGVIASFELGVVEGTMLLALSEDSLHAFVEEMANAKDQEYDETDSDYDSDEDGIRRKRAKKTDNCSGGRRLGEAPKPNRVYFRWAGRSPMEGYELEGSIDQPENSGYLDFVNDKAVANGEWKFESFFGDKKLRLAAFKVSSEPRENVSVPWRDFKEGRFHRLYPKWH